jgi:hypothetical protein
LNALWNFDVVLTSSAKLKKMETPKHSVEFQTGRLVLQSPCHVGKEAFSPIGDGNKFCSSCTKVVHDMTKLTEAEIKALFVANGGNVCGSIRVQSPKPAPIPVPQARFRKPTYLKQLAASAAFLLLYNSQQAKPMTKPQIAWQFLADVTGNEVLPGNGETPWKTNTLVTGVVINQDSELVPLEIPVLIYHGRTLVAQVMAVNGLFSIELDGKLKPEDVIEVVIKEHQNTSKSRYTRDGYGGGKASAKLMDAQNLNIKVHYEFPDMMIDGGMGWEEGIEAPDPLEITNNQGQTPTQP